MWEIHYALNPPTIMLVFTGDSLYHAPEFIFSILK